MFGVIMPLCNRMFCCIFGWYFSIEIRLKYEKLFCIPALELFHCLPLWKTVLFVSSRAFSLSTPTFLLSTPVENSEATWKKATKCNKKCCLLRTHLWTLANSSTYYNYCLILWYHLFFLYSYDVSNASLSYPSVKTTIYYLYLILHSWKVCIMQITI